MSPWAWQYTNTSKFYCCFNRKNVSSRYIRQLRGGFGPLSIIWLISIPISKPSQITVNCKSVHYRRGPCGTTKPPAGLLNTPTVSHLAKGARGCKFKSHRMLQLFESDQNLLKLPMSGSSTYETVWKKKGHPKVASPYVPLAKYILSQKRTSICPLSFERLLMFCLDHWSFYLYLLACSDIMAPETTSHEECNRGDYVYLYGNL